VNERQPGPTVEETAGTLRPAYYAARSGGWRDLWTLLHPPYTAWHLSYVVIGACLAPAVRVDRLVGTVLAFFFAVGVAAHALDEWNGRPLQTRIPSNGLLALAAAGIGAAVALGTVGVTRVGWPLIPFIVAGPLLVIAYNLDLAGRHKDPLFAFAWGGFPVLTAYAAETGTIRWPAILAAGAATALSAAQRSLSTPARLLRRRAVDATGTITLSEGAPRHIDREALLGPLERALHALSVSVVLLATALALARLT
jgi:hypothetical protein